MESATPKKDMDMPMAVTAYQVDPEAQNELGIRVGAWESGFFSCCDHLVPNCLMSWCCPWVTMAQITSRMGMYPYGKTLIFLLGVFIVGLVLQSIGYSALHGASIEYEYNSFGTITNYHIESGAAFSVWQALGYVVWLIYLVCVWQLRSRVRARFDLPGSAIGDFCASCCCGCCAIAQMATHVKSYQPNSCDFGPPANVLPAFK